jgi:hypothetical protein
MLSRSAPVPLIVDCNDCNDRTPITLAAGGWSALFHARSSVLTVHPTPR